jgi:Entner-Doudoroff aldolase
VQQSSDVVSGIEQPSPEPLQKVSRARAMKSADTSMNPVKASRKADIIARMLDPGVVAVIRADSSDQLGHVARALRDGGVTAMEVTMTTPNALQVIETVSRELGDTILMGVGTVLDAETARMAILAGAEFVVTPVMRPDVIALCNRYSKPIVAGAYTPTEALAAHEAGADFIKIFPADGLGPELHQGAESPVAAVGDHPDRRRGRAHGGRLYPGRLRRRRGGRQPGQEGPAEERGLGRLERACRSLRRRPWPRRGKAAAVESARP